MFNKFQIGYSPRKINRFYSSLRLNEFGNISDKRKKEIAELVEKNRIYFKIDTTNMASLATSAAMKLYDNLEMYKLKNSAEAAYFYMLMVDPQFEFLKAYNSIKDKIELKHFCYLTFGYYDNMLIYLEGLNSINKTKISKDGITKEVINLFYSSLNYNYFEGLTTERIKEIDVLAQNLKSNFFEETLSLFEKAYIASSKLTKQFTKYGLRTSDEALYFFIRLIDPSMQILEAYESISNVKELRLVCIENFGYYDRSLIMYEKELNKKLNLYNPDELWMRDTIKRTRNKFY